MANILKLSVFRSVQRIFEQMKKLNLFSAAGAFLLALIAVYFGASIVNANQNFPIEHLNELDNLHYYDVEEVPFLTFKAAMVCGPFLLVLLVLQLIILRKSQARKAKNIALALSIVLAAVLIFDLVIFFNPHDFIFSKWGFVIVFVCFFNIVGNMISVFIKGNSKSEMT